MLKADKTSTASGPMHTDSRKRPATAADLAQISIMLVDENRFTRRLVTQMCRTFEIRDITESADPIEALSRLKDRRFDLIICEYLLPGIDGLNFSKLIRTDSEVVDHEVPIILLTGHTQIETVLASRDAGITELLAKPLSPRILLSRILYVFDHPRPFIKVDSYIGPSRRRRSVEWNGEERRGSGTPSGQPLTAADVGLILGATDCDEDQI